jgi:hypothetical protein
MSYLGNTPDINNYTMAVQKFNGTGACTQFTLSRNVSDANTLAVVVNGVLQTPGDSYSVTSGILTFTEAPNSSANNITVTYLASSVVTYSLVSSSQLLAGSVTTTALAKGSVTDDKLASTAIFDDVFLFGGM